VQAINQSPLASADGVTAEGESESASFKPIRTVSLSLKGRKSVARTTTDIQHEISEIEQLISDLQIKLSPDSDQVLVRARRRHECFFRDVICAA